MSQQSYGRQPVSNPDPSPVVAEPPERLSAASVGGSTGQPDPTAPPTQQDPAARIAELEAALEARRAQHAETLDYLEHAYRVIDQQRALIDITERPTP